MVAVILLALLTTNAFDPNPPPGPETCAFLPMAERQQLPPEHLCHLPTIPPPEPPCEWPYECSGEPL